LVAQPIYGQRLCCTVTRCLDCDVLSLCVQTLSCCGGSLVHDIEGNAFTRAPEAVNGFLSTKGDIFSLGITFAKVRPWDALEPSRSPAVDGTSYGGLPW
jgi:hypothetical protein